MELAAVQIGEHLAGLGEADVETGDVVGSHTLDLHRLAIFGIDSVGDHASALAPHLLLLVPDASLESRTEASKVAESDGVAHLELFDDDLLEGDEHSTDIDFGEGTLLDDAVDDFVGGHGGVDTDGGVPSESVVLRIASLLLKPVDHGSSTPNVECSQRPMDIGCLRGQTASVFWFE